MESEDLTVSRKWLNDDETISSYILTEVGIGFYAGQHPYLSGSVTIADCYDRIHLGFYSGTLDDLAAAEKKIDLLVDELSKFRDELKRHAKTIREYNE